MAIPTQLQSYQVPEAPEYPPLPPPLRFPSHQEKEKQKQRAAEEQAKQAPATEGVSDVHVKPDIKPPRRLATTYLSQPGLLRMLGAGDEDHIITKVLHGTDPLQEYKEDDPTQIITIDYETNESSDADDLSVVSMTSAGALVKTSSKDYCLTLLPSIRKWQPRWMHWQHGSKTCQSNK